MICSPEPGAQSEHQFQVQTEASRQAVQMLFGGFGETPQCCTRCIQLAPPADPRWNATDRGSLGQNSQAIFNETTSASSRSKSAREYSRRT